MILLIIIIINTSHFKYFGSGFFQLFFPLSSSQFWIYVLWKPWSCDLSATQITMQVCLYIFNKSETRGVFPCLFIIFIGLPLLSIFKFPLPDGLIPWAEVNVIGKLDVVFALIVSGFGFYSKLWRLNNRILEMPQKIIEGSY